MSSSIMPPVPALSHSGRVESDASLVSTCSDASIRTIDTEEYNDWFENDSDADESDSDSDSDDFKVYGMKAYDATMASANNTHAKLAMNVEVHKATATPNASAPISTSTANLNVDAEVEVLEFNNNKVQNAKREAEKKRAEQQAMVASAKSVATASWVAFLPGPDPTSTSATFKENAPRKQVGTKRHSCSPAEVALLRLAISAYTGAHKPEREAAIKEEDEAVEEEEDEGMFKPIPKLLHGCTESQLAELKASAMVLKVALDREPVVYETQDAYADDEEQDEEEEELESKRYSCTEAELTELKLSALALKVALDEEPVVYETQEAFEDDSSYEYEEGEEEEIITKRETCTAEELSELKSAVLALQLAQVKEWMIYVDAKLVQIQRRREMVDA